MYQTDGEGRVWLTESELDLVFGVKPKLLDGLALVGGAMINNSDYRYYSIEKKWLARYLVLEGFAPGIVAKSEIFAFITSLKESAIAAQALYKEKS